MIVERAREAVVLNADCPLCLSMIPFPKAKRLCLVSVRQDLASLRKEYEACDLFALLEEVDGAPWMVLYDRGNRTPLVAVNKVPATWQGLAIHNVYNALHAGAACYLMGVSPDVVARGLSLFELNFETAPGRLNVYDGHPFRVLLDYAHNNDGIAHLCALVDQVPVAGRKIVAFSAAEDNPDELIRGNALALAGHFDDYICFNFPRNIENGHEHVPALLAAALRESGVASEHIFVAEKGTEALDTAMSRAAKGDLLVFLAGSKERNEIWRRITGS